MKIRTLEPVKSLHKYLGSKYGYFKLSKERKKWEKIIWGLCNGKPPKYDRKVTVRVTSMRTHELDEDNLAAGCKPIYDAMVKLGMIKDDSPKYCHMDPKQEKCRAMNAQTVVEVL